MTGTDVYVSVGLCDASVGLPFPSETIDERASSRKAVEKLHDWFVTDGLTIEYNVDFGQGEPFVHAPGGDEDALTSLLVSRVVGALKENMAQWMVPRQPYVGRASAWEEAVKRLRRRGFRDAAEDLDSYIAYALRKFEDNAIIVTDETALVVYLGVSDERALIDAVEQCGVRLATSADQHAPNKVTEIIYPLTAAETGFENDSNCDMDESLRWLAMSLEERCNLVFPHALCFFPTYVSERNKTGSLTMYSGNRLLHGAFDLERTFFEAAGEAVLDTASWYTRVE